MNDSAWTGSKPPPPQGRRDFWFACAVIGTVFAALAMHTWRKWPDILVDFGAQLYFPWKLSTGSVLYRDMAYLVGGPFSQYYHALLFKMFGVSFMTLVFSNLLITVLLLLVVYRCFYRSSDQLTAVTACLAIVMFFAFAHHSLSGLFNYITPYCSEIVHGLVLSVFAIALLAKWFREEKIRLAAAAGFCCGVAFLTKPEVFLALGMGMGAGLLLFLRVRKKPGFLARSLGIMTAAALVPVLTFLIYFWRVTDFPGAGRAVCAGWIPVFTPGMADNPYFRWCMGLDTPAVHLQRMFLQSFGLTVIVAAAAWLCRRCAPGGWNRSLMALAAAGLAALSLKFDWGDCGQCLPVVCLTLLALLLWRAGISGLEPGAVFPILWAVFSLGMLLKLGLFSRVWHYGFVLGMPALLCAIYLLLWLLPRELERCNVQPVLLRGMIWLPMMLGFAQLSLHSIAPYAWKTMAVGAGADKMWGLDLEHNPDETGLVMAMDWMQTHTPPQATLAVLPANLMLNYLCRRTNPTRYPIWAPPEIAAFGQQTMTDDFIRHSPDYIIIIDMEYGNFGEKKFGLEKRFGGDLMNWVNAHYQQRCLIGDDWLQTGRFGIKILQKKPGQNALLRRAGEDAGHLDVRRLGRVHDLDQLPHRRVGVGADGQGGLRVQANGFDQPLLQGIHGDRVGLQIERALFRDGEDQRIVGRAGLGLFGFGQRQLDGGQLFERGGDHQKNQHHDQDIDERHNDDRRRLPFFAGGKLHGLPQRCSRTGSSSVSRVSSK
jgi:hypothetical protein